MGKLRETLGLSELTERHGNIVWKSLLSEFLGNCILNFFGCAAIVKLGDYPHKNELISLAFGFTVFIIVHTLGHVSGAHVNPAVTAGMLVTGNIPVIRGILYVIAQCLGSITGSALLRAITPDSITSLQFGHSHLNPALKNAFQGMGIELFLGFLLVLTVFGVCDVNRPESKPTGALAIGIAVVVGHFAFMDYTGSSMNPARTFGSAVISGVWDNHWIYWVGPCIGGILAGLLYKHAFAAPATGIMKVTERYIAVAADEKELKRLDGKSREDA